MKKLAAIIICLALLCGYLTVIGKVINRCKKGKLCAGFLMMNQG